jgi:hypothetical protein
MKRLMSVLAALGIVVLAILAFKVVQKQCWDHHVKWWAPPSLQSWDPTERVEAARQIAKKYGGSK